MAQQRGGRRDCSVTRFTFTVFRRLNHAVSCDVTFFSRLITQTAEKHQEGVISTHQHHTGCNSLAAVARIFCEPHFAAQISTMYYSRKDDGIYLTYTDLL